MKCDRLLLLTLLVISFVMISCSNGGRENDPANTDPVLPAPAEDSQWMDWGSYTVEFDIENETAHIAENRDSNIHFDITPYLTGGSLVISFLDWDPYFYELTLGFWIDNPTNLSVSDVRLIFTDLDPDNSTQELLNADSYTTTTGQIRPFLAFNKIYANRIVEGYGQAYREATLYWPPGSPYFFNFKITAWLWVNCKDPYEITNMQQSGHMFQYSGNSTITCDVLDWQDDVYRVTLCAWDITGGCHDMYPSGGSTWYREIENLVNAPPGEYWVWFEAYSTNPQNYQTWHRMKVVVDEYGWQSSMSYNHGYQDDSFDIACYDYNYFGAVNILRPRGDNSSWIVESAGVEFGSENLVNLQNLDPTHPNYQPWPAYRIDAAPDRAFVWNNWNSNIWYDDFLCANTMSFMRESLDFLYSPLSMDNRLEYFDPYVNGPLFIVDVCDSFDGRLGGLFGDPTSVVSAIFVMLNGPIINPIYNYTDNDEEKGIYFDESQLGYEPGLLDVSDVSGIDIMELAVSGEYLAFFAQENSCRIEVFAMVTDVAAHWDTIYTVYWDSVSPVDIELLPPNPDFEPAPDKSILCVLVDLQQINGMTGGIVLLYDAYTGEYIDSIGTLDEPACYYPPRFLDTADVNYSIVISQQNNTDQILTRWTYYVPPA